VLCFESARSIARMANANHPEIAPVADW